MVPAVYSRTAMLVASAAAAAVALVLMTNTINPCGAAVLLKTNVTYDRYCAAADQNCLIAHDLELELEFFMDSHVSRFLGTADHHKVTDGTKIRNKAVITCGPGVQSTACHDKENKNVKHCPKYDRNCGQ